MLVYYLQMIESEEDKSKFEKIYAQYNSLLFYIARRYFKETQDVEDVVQDTYLSILANLEKIEDIYSSKTRNYFVIIIENKSRDRFRKSKGIKLEEWDDATPGLAFYMPEETGWDEAITKLPSRYRDVLMLKYERGYTVKEIAELLSTTPKAIESVLWRAKQALLDNMDKEGMSI